MTTPVGMIVFRRPAMNQAFDDWPHVGERIIDEVGRELQITEVNPDDPHGRNIVGILSTTQRLYACDTTVLLVVWRRPDLTSQQEQPQ